MHQEPWTAWIPNLVEVGPQPGNLAVTVKDLRIQWKDQALLPKEMLPKEKL